MAQTTIWLKPLRIGGSWQDWEPGAHCKPGVEGSSTGWRVSSVGACLSCSSRLVCLKSSLKLDSIYLGRTLRVFVVSFILFFEIGFHPGALAGFTLRFYCDSSGKEKPSGSGRFPGLPEATLSCLSPCLKGLHYRMECFNLRGNYLTVEQLGL